MATLTEVQKEADKLTFEDQAGLVAHLLDSFHSAPRGGSDEDVERREIEMDQGLVATISHEEFLSQVGRR